MYLYYNIIRSIYLIKSCIQNDYYDQNTINNIIESINNSGCLFIKIIQWILPRLYTINIDKKLESELQKFYDKCNIHDIEFTKQQFKKDFKYDINDKYQILEVIGSGSVGQVYKIKNIKNNKLFALKILHPNVQREFDIFKNIFYFTSKVYDLKKYLPINDYDEFFDGLEQQLDFTNEVNNILEFKQLHSNDLFVIPTVLNFSKNIIIMDYLEKQIENIDELSIVKKNNTFLKIFLYNFACSYYGICHGDLHKGNWGLNKNKLILYDFGYCLKINHHAYLKIQDMAFDQDRLNSFKKIIEIICDINNKDKKLYTEMYKKSYLENFKETIYIHLERLYKHFYEFLNEYKLYISSELFNVILISGNLEKLTTSVDEGSYDTTDKDNCYKLLEDLIDVCDSYDIFPEFKQNLIDNYKRKPDDTILHLDKYNFLKSKII